MVEYTPEMLKEFDRLTTRLSSRDQVTRIDARFAVKEFQRKNGEEVCKAMFAELLKRDKKRSAE